MTIGQHIKQTRRKALLTQNELAILTKLTRPTISKIENDSKNTSIDTLIKICDALDKQLKITMINKN